VAIGIHHEPLDRSLVLVDEPPVRIPLVVMIGVPILPEFAAKGLELGDLGFDLIL
jgi:hypothetical protein